MNNRPNRDNELTAYLNLFAFERLNVFQFNNEQYKLRIDECAKLINQFIDSKLVMDKEFEETIATLSKRIGIYYLLCENNRALGSQYLINYRTIHDVKNKLAAEQETRLTTNTISKDFIENEISYAETLTLIFYGLCNDVRIHENLAQQLKEHLNRYESLEKSIVHAANLSAIEIGKALTYYCIALTAGKNNFYEEAHLAIDCAIALQTRHAEKNFLVLGDLAESQRLKSILFKNQQQLPDAEESIKLSIETWANLNKQCSLIHPQLFEAQQTYAQILQSLKKYTEAVNLLNRTLGEQKNFYHTEMHHSIATTQLILGKILKEDNDLEHAYYELKNALMIATQLALPTTMITENIEDIFQQKQIPQLFRMLSHFPHYAWNQYSTTAAFAPIVTDIKRVIDGIIKETVYLDPAQQDV
jgi:tetratricopeptide (TPR) repeat protein